ncbi:hypothetical protein BFP97_16715 [Roseivirga sp. 4D4]|nr:hypothetical protein BFP97_16715 [Roseivirga sp. 4D4]
MEYIPKYLYKKQLLRPVKLGILFSVIGEFFIFLLWGVWLYPEGNILHKFLWTVVFCGLGMGATTGVLISWWVEGKYWGRSAIFACALISFVILGLFCNFVCFSLDMHFNYFGAAATPGLFIINGMFMSALGGLLIGWLNFSYRGIKLLEKYGL